MKKAELSMSMIIMAVIAIIILVIIIFLLMRSSGDVGGATGCPGKGGTCVDGYTCNTGNAITDGNKPLCTSGKTCCPIIG